MGEAREVMDRITERALARDFDALRPIYGSGAVLVDPGVGELTGEAIIDWYRIFDRAFPTDLSYEPIASHESGNTAIDEGYLVGVNTGPITFPDGDEVPATGLSVRLRACDVLTVSGGRVVSHHYYYDQLEFLSQLGLAPQTSAA